MKSEISISVRKLKNEELSDFIDLIRLFEDVFEMKDFKIPDSAHLQRLLKLNNFHVFVATSKGSIVGGLTTYVLEQCYSEKTIAYILDLAVDTKLQRRGIGRKLIAATNSYFENKGFEEVFVQADRIDDYAIDFYQKTNPSKEEDVIHFSYQLK